ncbi:MAG: glycosyltransferase [Coriobacteriia bacterium]|nr:glycosyltransferase [Coriobacteriia bacterium]
MATKYYPPVIGGIESHVRDLSEALVAAGHQVNVVCSNTEHRFVQEVINGVEITRLPRLTEKASTPITRHFGEILRIEGEHSDLIHFHFPYPWGEFQWLFQHPLRRTPFVVTYHTDIVRQKTALGLYSPFLKRFLDKAELIMASSPQLIEYSQFLEPKADKCRHVDFGLNLDHIANNEVAIARAKQLKATLPSERPVVLFTGRLVYYKGVEVLIDSMPLVDAEYVVIGSGPLEQDMIARAKELGVDDRLHMLGRASDEDLAAWYHVADVFALPSVETSEAFGLVQIEAHAAGTPVVSTLLKSGVPYANLDGVTGYSVVVGDAKALADGLNKVLNDPETAAKLGAQAKERALTQFSIPAMVDNVTEVYQEAIDSNG